MNRPLSCLFLLLSLPAAVAGCGCNGVSVYDRLARPGMKPFIGEVIAGGIDSIRLNPWYSPATEIRFKVLESFGMEEPRSEFVMHVATTAGMCSPMPYILGRRYLVFPESVHEGKESLCGFSGLWVDESADEVRYVRDYYAGRNRYRIRGQVAVTEHNGYVDLSLSQGESRPPKGVRITASLGDNTYETQVDARGWYELVVPTAGGYRINASGEGYQPASAFIAVPSAGCSIRDIALSTGNTIKGHLRNPARKPIPGTVTLRDADPTPEGATPFKLTAYADGPGYFSMKNVSPGRYVLRFEAEHPTTATAVWDAAYYPLNSTRATARVIEIKGPDAHITGLVIVPRPKFTSHMLAVRVRFPDGQRMTTANIRVTGDDWEGRPFIWQNQKDPWARIPVPANRKLRVAVTDEWKRDLKKEYAAEFDPGASDIEMDFVIEPGKQE